MGADCRQWEISVPGAGGSAQPGHRYGRDCDSRRSISGTRARRAANTLGEPRRADTHDRVAARRRCETGGDGRAGEAQQDFQFDSAGLEARKLLLSLSKKNTDSLIGAVARLLEEEGIHLVDSTTFLGALLPEKGVLTRRAPNEEEAADIAYGREVARRLAEVDLGQTVVISGRACVAIEAMEGTDETIERAARLTQGKRLVVVKVSKPSQDM